MGTPQRFALRDVSSSSATRVSSAESSAGAAQFTPGKPMRVAWAGSCSRSSVAERDGRAVRASKTTRCSGSCQRCGRSFARMVARVAGPSMRGDSLLAGGAMQCAATKANSTAARFDEPEPTATDSKVKSKAPPGVHTHHTGAAGSQGGSRIRAIQRSSLSDIASNSDTRVSSAAWSSLAAK